LPAEDRQSAAVRKSLFSSSPPGGDVVVEPAKDSTDDDGIHADSGKHLV